MATLYNKTALNKIKKADLIQMFLDQQAEKNYHVMNCDEFKQKLIEKNEELMEANREQVELIKLTEKLKEQIDEQYSFSYFKQIKELTAENKQLKTLVSEYKDSSLIHIDAEPHEILESM